jgi:hypothetical protein
MKAKSSGVTKLDSSKESRDDFCRVRAKTLGILNNKRPSIHT